MAAFRRILAIKIWFLCICVGVYSIPDTTLMYKICNGIKIPHGSAYGLNVDRVTDDLARLTKDNNYNFYTQAVAHGQVCYGHAACAGHLAYFDCGLCLVNAAGDLFEECPDDTGAQVQLQDCRMRYENYEFTE